MNEHLDRALCIWLASHMEGVELAPFRSVRRPLLMRGWIAERDDWGGEGSFSVTALGFEVVRAWIEEEMLVAT